MKHPIQTQKNDTIKNVLKYCLIIICIFTSAGILLVSYGYFLSLSNGRINSMTTSSSNQKKSDAKNQKIKRVGYLKYSHSTDNVISYYLLQMVQISGCDYIILSKTGQTPSIIHAASCKNHNALQIQTIFKNPDSISSNQK